MLEKKADEVLHKKFKNEINKITNNILTQKNNMNKLIKQNKIKQTKDISDFKTSKTNSKRFFFK